MSPTAGNTVVAVASERRPLPAVTLGEVLDTSDVPGGVVNLLTGLTGPLEQLKIPRFYYLYGGMKFPLDPRTKKVIFTPSILVRMQDGTPLSTDFNLSLAFEELISLGSSYRSGDGAISYINFKLSEKFYVGYSYDWTVSDIRMYSRGSHEIMINYRTRLRSIHRDLDCPQFFSH